MGGQNQPITVNGERYEYNDKSGEFVPEGTYRQITAHRAAAEKAMASDPELAKRLTVDATGTPFFDNVAVPPNVLAGGGKAIDAYLANAAEASNYGINPTAAKIAEAAVAPTITGRAHVEGARTAAEAGKQRYITVGGGTDPVTMQALPQRMYDTQKQEWVDPPAKPKPTLAVATANAQEAIKRGGTKEAANAILQSYGYPPLK
jgi:hypothetical protein